jgi:hypothetical protein
MGSFFTSVSKAPVLFVGFEKKSSKYQKKEAKNIFTGFVKLTDCDSTKFRSWA